MEVIKELFGPSIHLLIFEMFLENPNSLMNLREISRKVSKSPGSISRVLPMLVKNKLIEQIKVGKKMHIYRLNKENKVVTLIKDFCQKLKNTKLLQKCLNKGEIFESG